VPAASVAALLGLGLAACAAPSAAGQEPADPSGERIPRFVEVGAAGGVAAITVAAETPWKFVIDNIGTGVALLDYDLDSDLDLFQVQSSALEGFRGAAVPTHHLYRNDGGLRFTDVTAEAGLASDRSWGFGAAVGDYDNDGDPDLYLTAWGPHRLFRNEGNGSFSEVAAEAGVAGGGWGAGAAFFDYDGDAHLDLYVAKYIDFDPRRIPPTGADPNCSFRGVPVVCGPKGLRPLPDVLYRNNGDGTFSDASAEAGVSSPRPYFGLGVVTGDVDGDGDPDVFVANDASPNFLFINDGNGRLVEDALLRGAAYRGDGLEQAGMGCDMGDPDGDGDLDIFVNNFSHDYSTLYLNDGTGLFEDASLRAGLVEPTIKSLSWGAAFADLDLDGDEDLFITNSHVYPEADEQRMGTSFRQPCQVFLNHGAGRFIEVTARAGPDVGRPAAYRGAAFGDLDDDGDIDVAASRMWEPPALLRNDLPVGGHWVALRLAGTRSNRDAVAARVWVEAGGRRRLLERKGGGSFLSAGDHRLHFGLGPATLVESVEIRWPSGLVQKLGAVAADRTLTLVEPVPEPPPAGGP
jgi:hypothetical protein